jgi:hypothetical protein
MQKTETSQTQSESKEIEDLETITVTQAEYSALDEIYGLSPSVHSMVMIADRDQKGNYRLKGSTSAFEALQSDLFEEVYNEIGSASHRKQCRKLYRRLAPDGEL